MRSLPPTAMRWCTSGTVGPGSEADDTVQFLDVGSGLLGDPIATGHRNYTPTWQPPDYDLLATAGRDGYVRMWDRSDGTLAFERQVSNGPITALAFTPDGSRLLVAEQTLGSSRSTRPASSPSVRGCRSIIGFTS